jgi:tetratricopeptide (TPR) repeat protein
MDPAVQEGMLAIPWALDRLQAYEQSLARYETAIAALERARTRMDEAIKSIRSSVMVNTILRRDPDSERGWLWKVRDLPNVPETFFLQSLLAEHRFQEALKAYRDARMLGGRLDSAKKRIAELERGGPGDPAADPLSRLRRQWQPAWAGTVVWLAYATALSAPGSFDGPLSDAPAGPMELRATHVPDSFEGRAETLKPLRVRIDALRPRLAAIARAQDDVLEAISIKELEGQRATIERYLTEARFAVARIYDRQAQQATP